MENFLNYFRPHPHTHQKAHLLSFNFILIYILLFILLRIAIDLTNIYQPGVLGVNSSITVEGIIANTNQERVKAGLTPLTENPKLDDAARRKAANMFEENYWAHFAPSGKDPWGFIKSAGYSFSYAGENLAKNFYSSEEVVQAWMNSSSHRSNLLSSKYRDIGIAVVDGVLKGQQTTLVVQMFGTAIGSAPVSSSLPETKKMTQEALSPQPKTVAGSAVKNNPLPSPPAALVDPFMVTKVVGLSAILMVAALLAVDLIVLRRRGVYRISSHHLVHFSLLAVAAASLLGSRAGEIL